MKIIAHRGASGEFPENSLLAFKKAIKQGCDGIELDVQFHQPSGEFILLHDYYVLINGQQTHINKLSIDELLNFDLGHQQKICLLTSALETISTHCLINIEVKFSAQGEQLEHEILRLKAVLEQAIANNIIKSEQLILSSFNHHALVHSSKLLPTIDTAALIACCPINYARFCATLNVKSLNLSIDCLNQELVTDAHLCGLEVWVYTVDEQDDIERCLSYGVNGIFTNYPKRAKNMLLAR